MANMKNQIKSVLLDANRKDRFAMIDDGKLVFACERTKSGIPFPQCMRMVSLPFAGGFEPSDVDATAQLYLEQLQRVAN